MRKETTPGPWKLDEVWMLIKGPKGEEVCAIHAGAADGTSQRVQRNVAYANAQLIASAPELLEALEHCSSFVHDGKAYEVARNAIAKARGER